MDDRPISEAQHDLEHERERIVAKETAQRLEREVETTAIRLERAVQETATRIEQAVHVALQAVNETAKVHADAHSKEHMAHERIHTVEAGQVRKAETVAEDQAKQLSASLKEYKTEANEWRGSLRDQEAKYLRKDEAAILFDSVKAAIKANTDATQVLRETVTTTFAKQGGKLEGISATAKTTYMVVAALGIVLGIAGAVVAFVH